MMDDKVFIESAITMKHIGKIFDVVSDTADFSDPDTKIERIDILPGGLTNNNFRVFVNSKPYAVRIAGDGTEEYLDRKAEKHNAHLMSDLGVHTKIYHFDAETGNQVCKYLEDCKTLHIEDFKDYNYLEMAADIFKKYHDSDLQFERIFSPSKEIKMYQDLLKKKNVDFYEGYDDMVQVFEKILKIYEKYPPQQVPCHNDPLAENFIHNAEGIFLIDWEYSGMGDPLFDIGDYIIEMQLNEEQEKYFLQEYFTRDITVEEEAFINFNKLFSDVMWAMWAVVQIATGKAREGYWSYGMERWLRAQKLIKSEKFQTYLHSF